MPSEARRENVEAHQDMIIGTREPTLYVRAFADLFQSDFDLLRDAFIASGNADELMSADEYMQMILNQGHFDPAIRDGTWAIVRRVILDATIVVPIYEAISGRDVITGFALTSGERWDRGIVGGVGVLSLGFGVFGIIGRKATAGQIIAYMVGQVAIDMGVAGVTSLTNEILQEYLPPEVARLISAGVGIGLAWRLNQWYSRQWDQVLPRRQPSIDLNELARANGLTTRACSHYLIKIKIKAS